MPSMATCRGYEFAAPNPDVATLNEVEQRLVAARHPFQAIWPVHGVSDKLRAMGPVLNVPVSLVETTESVFGAQIPQLLNSETLDVFIVRLFRRRFYRESYLEAAVNEEKARRSAAYLEQQPLYIRHSITFNPNWTATRVPSAQESDEDTTHQQPEADDGADPGTTA
ncbi:hypothetical protein EV175_002812 [Coemansia sp. RSA 1933]|nr:hypothetical protein EV175_002812 [Coemansia sp. RSA 1933]